MPRIFSWVSMGLFGSFLWLAGCGKQLEHTSTEVLERTYEIDPFARLKIRNLRGAISIHGADTQELKLRATKTTAGVAPLQEINVSVAAESGSVSISTSVLPQKNRSLLGGQGTVDYDLIVPRTINIARLELEDGNVLIEGIENEEVQANVVDGKVTIRQCCANVHVTIANGDLDFSVKDCRQHSFSTDAQLTHGKARILLPRDASIHVRAQTRTGTVSNEFADMVQVNGGSTRQIDLTRGSGILSQLTVRVTTGDIKIAALDSEMADLPAAASSGSK
jgi:DUF4097 and DUF4098 domain-containing protein YvlB